MEEQLAEKTFSKEIITEAWAKLDTVYDSFVLSYNDNYVQIYEKNVAKDILNSYLTELKEIRGKLHSVIPFNGLQISKLQEEITRIDIILEWNKNKF